MILPSEFHDEILADATNMYPHGAGIQGGRELVLTLIGTTSNSFAKAGMGIRLGVDSQMRELLRLTVFTGSNAFAVPMTLASGFLTLGPERFQLHHGESAALLVRALLLAVQDVAAK